MSRYDIIEAYYWFFTHYHEGQGSDKYRRLCRMSRYYTPGRMANRPDPDSPAEELYNELASREEMKYTKAELKERYDALRHS